MLLAQKFESEEIQLSHILLESVGPRFHHLLIRRAVGYEMPQHGRPSGWIDAPHYAECCWVEETPSCCRWLLSWHGQPFPCESATLFHTLLGYIDTKDLSVPHPTGSSNRVNNTDDLV